MKKTINCMKNIWNNLMIWIDLDYFTDDVMK